MSLPQKLSKIVGPLIEVSLVWFLAGHDFNGATSWFWPASDLMRQPTGFGLYLVIATIVYSQ